MERITVYSADCFPLHPDREEVFGWLQCGRDLPCRSAYESAWDQAVTLLRSTAAPRAAVLREGRDRLTILLSLGEAAEARSSALFRQREYITGSLLNVLCDQLLFQMDRRAAALLQRDLTGEGLSLSDRLEPGLGLSVADQRQCLAQLEYVFPGVQLSEHGVICPAKSMMYQVMLSRQPCSRTALHDCARCRQKDCLYRDTQYAASHGQAEEHESRISDTLPEP